MMALLGSQRSVGCRPCRRQHGNHMPLKSVPCSRAAQRPAALCICITPAVRMAEQRRASAPRIPARGAPLIAYATAAPAELQHGLWEPDPGRLHDEMISRFRSADLDGNGVIDGHELRLLLEGFEDGKVAPNEHWLTDEEVNSVMRQYDADGDGSITMEEFEHLAKDGVLLHGTLQQYSEAFEAVDSDHDGLVTAAELRKLLSDCDSALDSCTIADEFDNFDEEHTGKIGFYQFLRMFRQHLIDLESVVAYLHKPVPAESTIDAAPPPPAAGVEPGQVKEIESEEELDEIIKADSRPLVLLAGFTWCRPCKGLQMPFQKLAEKYKGVKFVKFYGNANENTKRLFRDRLKARATPTLALFDANGHMGHTHSGANKSRLEFYLREFIGETDSETVYPPYQLTEKELEERNAAAAAGNAAA